MIENTTLKGLHNTHLSHPAMSVPLTDSEILELNDLCGALADDTLADPQRARLADLLAASEDARRYYVRAMSQSASLHTYAAETHADPIAAPSEISNLKSQILRLFHWRGFAYAAAGAFAAIALIATAFVTFRPAAAPAAPDAVTATVAQITGARDCEWATDTASSIRNPQSAIRNLPAPGARIPQGQKLRLTKGAAEITFDSGARVTLEAPASLDINSAWGATLRSGLLKASVPKEAIGFRIANRTVNIVDLGTEFAMNAAPDGTADIRVLKGEVEASPRGPDQNTLLIRENETLRFAATSITPIDAADPAYASLSPALALDPFRPAAQHYRISFSPADENAIVPNISDPAPDTDLYAEAAHGRALRLDGARYARATLPNLSSHDTHTIAFWIKIPRDTVLPDSYAMVAWNTALTKLNSRPVHISWNRLPSEGALGAIRTDFGGGHAIGATNLRDGRWHHIAIIFTPGAENAPVEVRQYVDAHLESGSITPGQFRATGRAADTGAPLLDTLWLGCRLGAGGPRQERFRGEIAEIHVIERALNPQEIVALMQTVP